MKNKTLFYDEKSRYNSVREDEIIFLTPKQLIDLDVGFPIQENFQKSEYDTQFPILLGTLKEMVKESTIGAVNGSDIVIPVENSECKVYICISINGKLCKLQSEEWDICNNLKGLPVERQIKVFQRLIMEKQITLEDLAHEDIDNSVYKALVVNELEGALIYQQKIQYLEEIYKNQLKDKNLLDKKQKILSDI